MTCFNGDMTKTFTTTTGTKGRTGSERRFLVVDRDDAHIRFRTDDLGRAKAKAKRFGPFAAIRVAAGVDVIDTETGEAVG